MDKLYIICPPSPAHKLEASILYSDVIYECSFLGVLTDEDMLQIMIDNELWSMEEEADLNSTPVRLDALKIEMYNKHINFQSRRVDQARRMIARLRKRQMELANRRHRYDLYTQVGLARTVSLQYLISHNTKTSDHQPVSLEAQTDWWLCQALEEYSRNRPDEQRLRELAQYNKWRMIWSSGRQEGRVFGVPSTWLTDEQQNLIAWAKLYDNVTEHPDAPPQDVMDDADLLDGWIIVQQKKRESSQRDADGAKHHKGGAQEMYVVAESSDDAKRIEAMNAPGEAFVKRQRSAVLKQHGVVSEQHMPDSKQQISMQAAQQFRDRLKGRT